ncbi:helix-turn-helix domain-containing protein [Candidatus Nitronereus thalassa]|uniref:XRE family transcriptional regulator n=1 Tax=Candidatus Nitronereus thalassa TaxID=3020898 RepID=A0ABU3K570_9BACT|nr:helix-turn-helix domain-containing protein [Candidatus Nitronereus thalassa]MDT7041512.1 XRE family transcriptional regulator [Candidatus Nitronereus thalassa]
MPLNQSLQAWRKARQYSISKLSSDSGVEGSTIEEIEAGVLDPLVSIVEALAKGLAIPPAWLYSTPKAIELLLGDPDGEESVYPDLDSPDPVTERILRGHQSDREMYVLLTSLLRHGEPKLLRAAEVNLRSLLKQARTATVPWQTRPSGHFEPPSD